MDNDHSFCNKCGIFVEVLPKFNLVMEVRAEKSEDFTNREWLNFNNSISIRSLIGKNLQMKKVSALYEKLHCLLDLLFLLQKKVQMNISLQVK